MILDAGRTGAPECEPNVIERGEGSIQACICTSTTRVEAYGSPTSATLAKPEQVMESLSDTRARLYYRLYVGTHTVVVKTLEADAFVVTAYLTDKVKKGRQLWPRKS